MLTIPLTKGSANAHPRFSFELGNKLIDFELNYVSYLDAPAWSMDLYHDGLQIVAGAMLEPGCDVIADYNAGIGHLIFIGEEATLDNLGVSNQLVWVGGE
jgi:hypothetical protein